MVDLDDKHIATQASQETIAAQLSRVEQKLVEKLEGLSARLRELSENPRQSKARTSQTQRHVHFASQRTSGSLPSAKTEFKEAKTANSHGSDSEAGDSDGKSDCLKTTPSTLVNKMPSSLDEASTPVQKSVWQRLGAKPSEAAKQFVHDTLSKRQRKKMTKRLKQPFSDEERAANTHNPSMAPIDALLHEHGQRNDVMTKVASATATTSCWWNPHSENNMWLMTALKKAGEVKDSVHDVLLAKGWVNHDVHGLSNRQLRDNEMLRPLSERVANSPSFEMCCSFLIILNAALLGYQTQCKADSPYGTGDTQWQETAQTVFTIIFMVEVTFRINVHKLNFFVNKDVAWNMFDLIVVGISAVELGVSVHHGGASKSATNLSGVRVVRILRLVRVVRFIRVVRFFSELRMMIYSSLKAIRPFMWALGILLLIIYMFAIVITQSVSDYRVDYPNSDVSELMRFFGSLPESVFTLFMVISGGVSWIQPAEELIEIHWSFAVWMSLYVSFVVFAVLNIVTGIFIQSAMKSAESDQDVVIQEQLNHQDSLAQGFLEVFHQCDEDNSGYIDSAEFEKQVSDYRVRAFLYHLGIDVAEAHGLFRLLDIAGTGRVYAKEFVMGCQQLKGPAKNVDVATLLFQNKRMMALWAVFMSYVEDQFAIIVNGHNVGESTFGGMSSVPQFLTSGTVTCQTESASVGGKDLPTNREKDLASI